VHAHPLTGRPVCEPRSRHAARLEADPIAV
jgi:hypothetical protein